MQQTTNACTCSKIPWCKSPPVLIAVSGIGGAMRLGGTIVGRECSFLSNSASMRGFAVAVEGSANISITTSSFEGNELYCTADSYRKDTEQVRHADNEMVS